jgi:hypothetical protein
MSENNTIISSLKGGYVKMLNISETALENDDFTILLYALTGLNSLSSAEGSDIFIDTGCGEIKANDAIIILL